MKLIEDIRLTRNFMLSEFACNDKEKSVKIFMPHILTLQDFIYYLEAKRYAYIQCHITSGYRTEEYNQRLVDLKKASPNSQHPKAKASDCKFYEVSHMKEPVQIPPIEIYKYAIDFGQFTGIGVYNTFNHLDNRIASDIPNGKTYSQWDERG